MRFAVVTATPTSIALGSGTYVAARNLQAGLEALGHEVELITAGEAFRGLRPYALARLAFNFLLSPGRARGCRLLCGLDMDGWRLAGRVSAPYVAYLHGVIADEARFEAGWTHLSMGIQARAERSAARHADLVLAPSRYSAGRIAELYGVDGDRIRTVEPGFDVHAWQVALAGTAPVPASGLKVLCVGRMYPRKNHAGLLRAVALLKPRLPGLSVRIVGDGPERARLGLLARRLGVEQSVRFLGQLPFRALVREYAECDVFCLPTLQEGFGMVFAEAMTAGKPIVACEAGATPEVVKHGRNGYLTPPGDDVALSEALAALLEDPPLRQRLGQTNAKDAAERFGLESAARAFLEAIAPLL